MAGSPEEQIVALRVEVIAWMRELHQKADATNAVVEARTEAIAQLSKAMAEISDGVKTRTEELLRGTEVGCVGESERTTRLVEELRLAIDAVGQGKLSKIAERLLEQHRRDAERIKFVLQSLKPDIDKLQHESWKTVRRFEAQG